MLESPTSHDLRDSASDADGEPRFVLHDVPWHVYVTLRDTLDERGSNVRITYLDGELELMSPSERHEEAKKIIARLLETWAEELDIDLNGRGNQTFRQEAARSGLEPDECYSRGPFGSIPDIALEVVVARPIKTKLEAYARLGVPEVWIWQKSTLTVHELENGTYVPREQSSILPELDIEHLSRFVIEGQSQIRLIKRYREELRQLRITE